MALNRRSPVAPVLFVLSLALTACGKPEAPAMPTPAPAPPPKVAGPTFKDEVPVVITLKGEKPMPDRDPVVLHQGQGEVAHWYLVDEGELTITIKDPKKDPFESGFENAGRHARSGRAKKDSVAPAPPWHKFGYTITVKTKKGTFTYDPDVEIQP